MSNDSREAFEAWHNTIFKASLNYVDIGNSVLYRDPFVHARWNAWQANESRHEAEREALVRKLKEMLAETNRKTMHGQGNRLLSTQYSPFYPIAGAKDESKLPALR